MNFQQVLAVMQSRYPSYRLGATAQRGGYYNIMRKIFNYQLDPSAPLGRTRYLGNGPRGRTYYVGTHSDSKRQLITCGPKG